MAPGRQGFAPEKQGFDIQHRRRPDRLATELFRARSKAETRVHAGSGKGDRSEYLTDRLTTDAEKS